MGAGFWNRAGLAAALALAFASAQSAAARADGKVWHAGPAGVEYGTPETDDWIVRLSCGPRGAIRVAAGPGDAVTGETTVGRRSPFVQNLLRGFPARVVVQGRRVTVPAAGAAGPIKTLLEGCPKASRS